MHPATLSEEYWGYGKLSGSIKKQSIDEMIARLLDRLLRDEKILSIGSDDSIRLVDHRLKPAVEIIRAIVPGASPEVGEEIKRNSPGIYFSEFRGAANVHSGSNGDRQASRRDMG